ARVEDEALDIWRELGMGLVAIPARDTREHEPAARHLVLAAELRAQRFDPDHRELDELREQSRLDRLGGGEHDRLDGALRFRLAHEDPSGVGAGASFQSSRRALSSATSPGDSRRTSSSPKFENCRMSTTPCL